MARDELRKKQFQFSGIYLVIGLGLLLVVQVYMQKAQAPTVVPYSAFLQELRAGRLAEIQVRDTQIVATRKPDGETKTRLVTTRLPGIDETLLLQEMEAKGVIFTGHIEVTSWIESFVLGWLLPIGLMVGLWVFFLRRMNRSGGPLSVGRNKAKIYDATQAGRVTFDDVAGVDEAEAELVEVVDFLKNPSKYTGLGARIPKGVLLVGPPGTGKTLLAKAVAGEAGVPFFSMSGSEFVEMFVGVGASRMRDLFDEAKKRAPCIVFLDELDAIGKSRGGVAALSTHDEREQTLNQLLVEMDGFETAGGVIIMAATNRPEVLDQALLRAGRFDRQVLVDRPDLRGREAILEIHMRVAKIGEGVDVKTLAQRTPGMVGADLAKVVNEAALAAARRGSPDVAMPDFEESIDRILLGLKKTGRVMNEKEKWRVAYHESGHALVALSVANADPVHRVSIIPRSIGALGVTLQLPAEDRYLLTKEELLDRITVLFGGRVAEELFCSDISSGASNDIERATDTARMMVTRFGMTAALGPVTYGRSHAARFLDGSDMEEKNYSEETARRIDAEVRAILDSQMERARLLIQARRSTLEAVAHRLLEVETLDRPELEALFRETKENA